MANHLKPHPITRRQEDCLEALYELSKRGPARLTDLSCRMRISKPSTSSCLERLERMGMVTHDHYAHFNLTPLGVKVARGVSRTHALLSRFLSEALGVPPEKADGEACSLEHAFTPETIERLRKFMAERGGSE